MTDVFISYSRREKVFTQKLFDALIALGRDVWADWDDIPAASDWDAEIKEGIEKTELVLFVLSPEWLKSNECRKELDHALKMGKRLLPILHIMVDPKEVPAELAKINWIYMRETDEFDNAFKTLVSAMETDLDWVKTHTRIQVRALEWDKKNRENSFTLRGNDLVDGEQFISVGSSKDPEPTPLQGEYILASRKDANRRQRLTLIGVTAALVVSVALGVVAIFQWQAAVAAKAVAVAAEAVAVEQRDRAEVAEVTAEKQRDIADLNAKMSFARELSAQAKNNLSKDPERSLLLTLQAVDVTTGAKQPILTETYDALRLSVQSSRIRYTLKANEKAAVVNSVAFNPAGNRLAAADDLGVVTVWDVSALLDVKVGAISAQPIFTFKTDGDNPVYSVAFSPNGEILALGDAQGEIILLDASTGKKTRTTIAHDGAVKKVAFSPDGLLLATASDDGYAIVRDVKTDEILQEFTDEINSPITGISFNADGTQIATSNIDATILIWDIASGQVVSTLLYTCGIVGDVAVSPNGNQIASSEWCPPENLVKIVNVNTLEETTVEVSGLGADQVIWENDHTENVNELTFSPDGNFLASAGDDDKVVVTNVNEGGDTSFILYDDVGLFSVAYSSDGKYIVTGNAVGSVKIWDASPISMYESGNLAAQRFAITGLIYSPDGTHLVTSDSNPDEPVQNIWDLASGAAAQMTDSDASIASLDFSPDGKTIVAGSYYTDCKLIFFDATSGKKMNVFHDPACEESGGSNSIYDVTYSPDGKSIAAAEGASRAAIWDTVSGEVIQSFDVTGEGGFVYSVAFSPDGKLLATGDELTLVTIWDIAAGKKVSALKGHTGWVYSVAFSPDGKRLLSGSADGTAIMWDMTTGEKLFTLKGHAAGIKKAIFNLDGALIATASNDGSVKVWDASSGVLISTISISAGPVSGLAFSPDGKTLAAGSQDGGVRFYYVNFEDLLALAKTRATRSLTLEECNTYLHVEQCP